MIVFMSDLIYIWKMKYWIDYNSNRKKNESESNFRDTQYNLIWLLFESSLFYLWINKKTPILYIKVIYFLKTRPFHTQRKIFRTLPIGKVRLAWKASLPNGSFAYVFRLPE